MEETRNTPALILNRQPYREHDSLVTVYTSNYGKLSLVARGTQKLQSKLAGHLEPLTLADIMIINGKGRDYIGSAVNREIYSSIREDLNKLYYAGQVLNIFNRLVRDNQADARLFFLLQRWLEVLNEFTRETPNPARPQAEFRNRDGELLYAFLAWRLASELGYQPEIYHCLSCGQIIKSGVNYFSLSGGGIICGHCFTQQRQKEGVDKLLTISDDCVKIIRFIMNNKLKMAEKLKIDSKLAKEVYYLTRNFMDYQF
jgi:DNA repair protein RecO (recombination protein O)